MEENDRIKKEEYNAYMREYRKNNKERVNNHSKDKYYKNKCGEILTKDEIIRYKSNLSDIYRLKLIILNLKEKNPDLLNDFLENI